MPWLGIRGNGTLSHALPRKFRLVKFFGRRSVTVDLAVSLPFLLLYSVFTAMLSGRLRRRYPLEDGWTAPLIMFTLCSLAFGVAGVLLGEQWSILVENVRVGTGHLSYRVDRLPWVRYHFGFFLLCLAVFWASAAARYKMSQRERP